MNLTSAVASTVRLAFGGIQHAVNGQTPPSAYQSMIRLFCATSGASNDAMSSLLGLVRPPYKFDDVEGELGHFSPDEIERIGSDIRTNGYHVFKNRLSDDVCDELLEYALTAPCIKRGRDGDEQTGGQLERFPRSNPDGIRYEFSEEQLINNPVVQKFMADRSFIAVAQNYLEAQPIADVVTMWWSVASSQPDKNAAQYWHFDMDRIKWLKFFIYLTDVSPENGPHSFVAGSHRSGGISPDLLQKGYSRLTDEEVSGKYSSDKFIEFTAPRGTVIAEDTRGLHKGKHLTKGDRLLFQIQFSNSLFGGDYRRAKINDINNDELADMIKRFPRIYSNYDHRI